MSKINVTIWNEFVHERNKPEVARIYPRGIHDAIAQGLRDLLANRVEVLSEGLIGLEMHVWGETAIVRQAIRLCFWRHDGLGRD